MYSPSLSLMVAKWRPVALQIVTNEFPSTETVRSAAWRFLKQHGVARSQIVTQDDTGPEAA